MQVSEALLGSRVAIQCARRAHNDHDPTLADLPLTVVPVSRWAIQGIEFEAAVVEQLTSTLGDSCTDLRSLGHRDAAAATVDAMASGVPVIIGAALPDDSQGHRRGRPDLLVRNRQRADGAWGYFPADIKSHQVVRPTKTGAVSTADLDKLANPDANTTRTGLSPNSSHRLSDLMQLAHYWRMLEACGHASDGDPVGGLVGSDTFAAETPYLVWQSLTEPVFTTFSRSRGTAQRSALERYDHEFDFRVRVIDVAEQQGEPHAPLPLVRPVIIDECDSCPWHDVCFQDVGDDEPSAHVVSGRLGLREWNALRVVGVVSVHDLAGLSLDDPRLASYWPELDIKESRARSRLENAVTRAQMSIVGERLRPTGQPIPQVPRADVEVDFDLEWDADNRIYLWGLLVSDGSGQRLESVYSWDPLDGEGETDLASVAIARLVALRREADSSGRSFRVYHYSHPEVSMVRNLIKGGGPHPWPSEQWWEAFTAECFVDLLPIVKSGFIGLRGLGLKEVAQAAGFTWQDDDPGGEQSMDWIEEARRGGDPEAREAARRRLLDYNTDDVRATRAVREWLVSGNRLITDI
jgi:predicted RecB family nuclease